MAWETMPFEPLDWSALSDLSSFDILTGDGDAWMPPRKYTPLQRHWRPRRGKLMQDYSKQLR